MSFRVTQLSLLTQGLQRPYCSPMNSKFLLHFFVPLYTKNHLGCPVAEVSGLIRRYSAKFISCVTCWLTGQAWAAFGLPEHKDGCLFLALGWACSQFYVVWWRFLFSLPCEPGFGIGDEVTGQVSVCSGDDGSGSIKSWLGKQQAASYRSSVRARKCLNPAQPSPPVCWEQTQGSPAQRAPAGWGKVPAADRGHSSSC